MPRLRPRGLLALLLALPAGAQAASWRPQPSPSHASLRGLSVVSARVAWASGSDGTYLATSDGGAHWRLGRVPGASRLDFRDVKAFSPQVAYLMAVAAGGGIYKTSDGGARWAKQYGNSAPGFFLDGLAFWDSGHGLALGDPLAGRFLLLRSGNGGRNWKSTAMLPPALPGEGAFAASGTALVAGGGRRAWFATGGRAGARVFRSSDGGRTWKVADTPMSGGTDGAGIFSLAFADAQRGIAVGGDYTAPNNLARTAALTADGGRTWRLVPGHPLSGYRSAVAYQPGSRGRVLVAVGPNGTDASYDGGANWTRLSDQGFNALAFAPDGSAWGVGAGGRIARLRLAPGARR